MRIGVRWGELLSRLEALQSVHVWSGPIHAILGGLAVIVVTCVHVCMCACVRVCACACACVHALHCLA